jgi:hypothetical protein
MRQRPTGHAISVKYAARRPGVLRRWHWQTGPVGNAVRIATNEISEQELEGLFAQADPHPLIDEIPDALRAWLLPISWDLTRLWHLDGRATGVPVAALRWHYDLPWWRGGDRAWFRVRPAEFIAAPERFPDHARRVASADLSFPLYGLRRRGRVQILDGIHRLVRADQLGHETMSVVLVTAPQLATILVSAGGST